MAEGPDVDQQKSATCGEKSEPSAEPAAPILQALQIPRSVIDGYYTKQKSKEPQERTKYRVQVGTFIIASLALVISAYQGCLTRRAVQNSQDALRLDQRAWVGAIEVENPSLTDESRLVYLKEGFPLKFGVVTNTGKTPAVKASTIINWRIMPPNLEFSPDYGQGTPSPALSLTVIQPQMRLTISPGQDENRPTKQDIADLKSGERIFYLFGMINYSDIFDKPHSTKFCVRLMPSLDVFGSCKTYNEAN